MSPESRASDLSLRAMSVPGAHVVQFYENDAFLAETVGRIVQEGLTAGEVVIWIATPHHHQVVEAWVERAGADLVAARATERYVPLDVTETLASFMTDGALDTGRFTAVADRLLNRATKASLHGRFRVVGEGVAVLWIEGRRETAIALEALWVEECRRRGNFSLLCPYPLACFGAADDVSLFTAICGQHTHVVPAEGSVELDASEERLRAIAELQQQTMVRETEMAHGGRAGFTVACKHCHQKLLTASRIGTGEAAAIAAHLDAAHPGTLRRRPATLGEVLREVRVEAC
jgi:hypothetical protein